MSIARTPFLIGVAGGTASGKTSVCRLIMSRLSNTEARKRVVAICQDSFYKDLTTESDRKKAEKGEYNFDHPNAFDNQLMLQILKDLKAGLPVKVPKYDFCTNSRVKDDFSSIESADVVIVEGILIFYDPELRNMFNVKLFVDADPDIRLARRVERDTMERQRNLNQVIHQYLGLVKPAFEEFCLPTKKYADVIIPRGADNEVAIDLIVKHIEDILRTPRHSPEPKEVELPPVYVASNDGGIQQVSRPH
ncbi:unnamed protein product [Bursaphelenchus xylophilus]|uniref:Uridine kinase n=1 Tax=Bursaphelenchus xylophilus TaxID=6326 RepID=A0A1I7SVL1_BURXY|nr:unnamed protein product [Bursaphelenchus xylophilus]CAG9101615.1 unnamed protein product [Bursaphelenchus xylophilus]